VLRCPHAEMLARYIRGELEPNVLLVDTAQVAEFATHLTWAGLRIEPQLAVAVKGVSASEGMPILHQFIKPCNR
jgi:hypothetical protein